MTGRRCYQHFALRCANPTCEAAERKMLENEFADNVQSKMSAGVPPETSWSLGWRRSMELAQIRAERAARRAELGIAAPAPTAPAPAANFTLGVPGSSATVPVQMVRSGGALVNASPITVPASVLQELNQYVKEHGLLKSGN